jgi:CDP-glycerol glycerophosphotransferase (TagB/SpsB family)
VCTLSAVSANGKSVLFRIACAPSTHVQHGLSVQDLTFDSNRVVNNNKRYYCASRHEITNLSQPEYDYDPQVLRLTGIPRYDGLINDDRRQILITPTWRSYIAMPAVMGSSRPYNPDFCNTDYYRIFQSLLENEKLAQIAEKTGYRIIYLLHPVISAQKKDFHPGKGVELVSSLDISYEEILTQSSLMVTDYSGVQFDFAYMRKPVVYFHPPELPPHYKEGGFFYDTQGFGEICTDVETLVETLCGYMESECRLKDFYRARQDDFFAFDDHENCRRIYEDALEYQRSRCEKV